MSTPKLVRFKTVLRRLKIGCFVLVAGVLPNHLSCSRVVGDPLVNGVGVFLTNATADLLSRLLLPGLNAGGGGAPTDGSDDPFTPPVQG